MSFFDPCPMDHEDDDDIQSCSESVEELPFALVDTTDLLLGKDETTTSRPHHADPSFVEKPLESPGQSQQTEKTSAMGSSILYSPMSDSQQQQQHNNFLGESSQLTTGGGGSMMDEIEFDAAASLLAESPMLGRSSHFMERSEKTTTYSQLMQEADDQPMTFKSQLLPTLPEDPRMRLTTGSGDASLSSVLTPRATNQSLIGLFDSAKTSSSHNTTGSRSSPFLKRGIETVRLDEETFETSLHIYSSCSVQDVMDIVGNPDLLRLWCEPVRTLVVTRSSEGARSAIQRAEPGRGDREVSYLLTSLMGLRFKFHGTTNLSEFPTRDTSRSQFQNFKFSPFFRRRVVLSFVQYDGEWIEATTSTLTDPIKQTSTVYQLGQFLWNNLGFPSYGKLTMFVERQRGQIGLTMGPFAGDMTAFHTISIVDGGGFIKIVDRVRIARDDNDNHTHAAVVCCCGLCDVVQRCFMPSKLNGHMDQSEASMARLRVMVENGETALSPPDLIVEGEDENGVSTVPLLS